MKSKLIVLRPLNLSSSDNRLESYIRSLLANRNINIQSFYIRSITGGSSSKSKHKCAFITVEDSNEGESAKETLDGVEIDGVKAFASFGKTQAPVSPSPTVLQARGHLDSYYLNQDSSSLGICHLHIAPLPSNIPQDEIISSLKVLLKEHFFMTGTISIKDHEDYTIAFVPIHNLSTEPSHIILQRLSSIVFHGHKLNVKFLKNPKPLTSLDYSYLESSLEEARIDSARGSGRRESLRNYHEDDRETKYSSPTSILPSRVRSRSSRSRSPRRTVSHSRFATKRSTSPDFPSRSRREHRLLPDPFDAVNFDHDLKPQISSNKKTYQDSTIVVSLDDSKSLERLSVPIHTPFDPTSFTRTSSTQLSFGYLSPSQAQEALTSSSSPFSNQEELQIQYESFLISQLGDSKEYYFDLLEKVKSFSKRNKLFGEIAKGLVDLTTSS